MLYSLLMISINEGLFIIRISGIRTKKSFLPLNLNNDNRWMILNCEKRGYGSPIGVIPTDTAGSTRVDVTFNHLRWLQLKYKPVLSLQYRQIAKWLNKQK